MLMMTTFLCDRGSLAVHDSLSDWLVALHLRVPLTGKSRFSQRLQARGCVRAERTARRLDGNAARRLDGNYGTGRRRTESVRLVAILMRVFASAGPAQGTVGGPQASTSSQRIISSGKIKTFIVIFQYVAKFVTPEDMRPSSQKKALGNH
jgi:hypothetical protein